ncbi:hypothetical protein JHK85_054107 [Glycine max]|nr:hypothetical protein JHK85_054045 [Glycine max]KAG4927621.1 hypothetical protein JHK85_054107 [Glycine max]
MEISKHTNRSYEDFDPLFMWRREEARDTLELHLPGMLHSIGERHFEGNRWKRFKKEFEIPSYCNDDAIHGNMMQSILSVVMPKKSPQISQEEQEHKKERRANKKEDTEEASTKEGIAEEDIGHAEEYHQFEENYNYVRQLPQETTREVALKFMLVMVLILVIASYLADVSKSLMAQGASYFHN